MDFRAVILGLTALLTGFGLRAQETQGFYRGFAGGMMIHSGYVRGTLAPIGRGLSGAPFGVGGAARVLLGDNFRIGAEGHVSTLSQNGNGSYVKQGWGGLLLDGYLVLGRWMPYAGITIGGGGATTFLMNGTPAEAWAPVNNTIYHREGFFAFAPFVGCDYIVTKTVHLTLKADCLHAITGGHQSYPIGPRLYFGFLFYH